MFIWREQLRPGASCAPGAGTAYGVDRGFTGHDSLSCESRDVRDVSRGPFGDFNLGLHVGDDLETVQGHRSDLADALGVGRDELIFMHQCHGVDVEVVDGPRTGDAPPADAVVTRSPDLALAVLVADCTPVLLADRTAGVVAAAHAGRPGMIAGIVPRVIGAMRDLGATDLEATVGPSVCGRCYEVPESMRADAARTSPASATVSWTGTPAIDVAAGVVDQLRANDVAVQWIPGCTRESPELYSYRREHVTGRFAGVIRLVDGQGRGGAA